MNIYADFNGIVTFPFSEDDLFLDLTGYGTLASLSAYKIKLQEGMVLTFVDPDGLTLTAPVYFYKERVKNNCAGWFAKFKKADLLDGSPIEHDYSSHLCFNCRRNIKSDLETKIGRNYSGECLFCGTPIMYSLSSPNP